MTLNMTRLGSSAAALAMVLALAGCPDEQGGENPITTVGVSITASAGTSDTGDSADDGGSGMIKLDTPAEDDTADGTAGVETGEECASVSETANVGLQPADILFVVDNSGSMTAEAGFVQTQMNAFSSQIFLANIDAHVVLISSYPNDSDQGICIDQPLGSGGCPLMDTNEPQFLHINDGVGSNNAFDKILQHAPEFMADPWWRPTAAKHVVVVTDDDADMDSGTFDQMFRALDPSHESYVFHAIASPEDPVVACIAQTTCCPGLPLSAALSQEYIDLVMARCGIFGNLCEQNFGPVFDQLSTAVVSGATLACEYTIPPPPEGEEFDPDKVNVVFDSGVGTLDIGRVDTPADCPDVEDGWYYDDPANPTTIIVCPQTCTKIQGFETASIDIQFGCATVEAPPVG